MSLKNGVSSTSVCIRGSTCATSGALVGWAALNGKKVAAMEEPRPILYGVADYAEIHEANAWFIDRTAKIRDLEKVPV